MKQNKIVTAKQWRAMMPHMYVWIDFMSLPKPSAGRLDTNLVPGWDAFSAGRRGPDDVTVTTHAGGETKGEAVSAQDSPGGSPVIEMGGGHLMVGVPPSTEDRRPPHVRTVANPCPGSQVPYVPPGHPTPMVLSTG